MFAYVGADLLRVWVRTAVAALGEARADLDALNVFPVPDGDTGTNMYLTMAAAGRAMAQADSGDADPAAGTEPGAAADEMSVLSQALVNGALLGARGNSGVILSQILRGMVRVDPVTGGGALRPAAEAIMIGLQRGSDLAYAAVAEPKEGTMLTVIRRAAEAAAECGDDDLPAVVRAAADAAAVALAGTTEQLEPLRRAGVVDSGGAGIVVILSALREVITGERPPPSGPHKVPMLDADPDSHGYAGPSYEVMYLLEADDGAIPALKHRLAGLGDSLLVVGGDRLWNVHVHVEDAGAAVEAGMAAGRPYRIRITWLRDAAQVHHTHAGRALVAVTYGPGIGEMLDQMGITTLPARPTLAPTTGEVLQAVLDSGASEAVILPGDSDIRASAESAAVAARKQGLRVAVVPTRSVVQSLAAVAVHDSGVPFDDDVVAMSRAAGATRYGAVTVSTREAMTTAGRCSPGDVLGIVDGDILVIGSDTADVARRAFELLLGSGGELVTIVTGRDADDDMLAAVTRHLTEAHPAVDVSVYAGGQELWPLIFGVE